MYERGIDLFGFPIAFDIWTLYLNTFVSRFGGEKLERTRELFESAVEKVPPKYAKSFYLMYAKHEEEFGLGIYIHTPLSHSPSRNENLRPRD